MKLAIVLLMGCGLYLLSNAKRDNKLKQWIEKRCPKVKIEQFAKELVKSGQWKKNKKSQLKKLLKTDWCPELTDPENGKVKLNCDRGFARTAKYSCNEGYQLQPKDCEKRQCLCNRTWSGEAPKCVADCGPLPDIANGRVLQTGTLEGAVAQYKCFPTFTLTSGSAERVCLGNRTYSGDPATCDPVQCANLSPPMFGYVSQSGSMVGATAQYTCQSGYQLQGPPLRFCSKTGSWTGTEPTCEAINCITLQPPMFGSVSQSGSGVGSTATYTCNSGYQLQGASSTVCLNHGGWADSAPTCEEIDCGLPESPCDGKAEPDIPGKTTVDHNVTYSCNPGFFLPGNPTRTCTASGWSGSAPCCVKGCVYSGTSYVHGEAFKPEGDCQNCICEYGTVTCFGNTACGETRTASQSSDHSNYRPAHQAIDGNFDTIAHTAQTPVVAKPWWMVEYDCAQTFVAVAITNRRDCCWNQLRQLVIYVDNQVCGQITNALGRGETRVVECHEPLTGKILKIEKQVQQVLNLAEVKPVLLKPNGCMLT